MSKPIPTIQQLYTKLVTDLKTQLGIVSSLIKFVINAMSGVLAAQLKLLYLYLVDIQNNQFPDTADTAANGGTLERQGMIYLNRLPFPASNGIYTATVTGTTGALIVAGSIFKSNAGTESPGQLYTNDADYYLPNTIGVLPVRSMLNGLAYLLDIGDTLTPTAPILGVNDTITVASITQSPVDAEDPEVYRQLILNAIRLQPQGGSKADYRLWSADANGVRLVFPYVKNGEAGTVQIFTEAVLVDSIDGKGTPSGALLTEVDAVIDMSPDTTLPTIERVRRPIQANVVALAITPQPVDVTITGLQTNTSAVQSSISANLVSYLYAIRPYIAGCDLPADRNDTLTAVKLQSVVNNTIGNSNTFLSFAMFVSGVQTNINQFSLGNIPYLRNVTYN